MVSFEDIQRREIAIFGTGLNAVKCAYYMLEKRKPIKCFLNNNKLTDNFLGRPVYEPDHVPENTYVVIAVESIATYMQLSKQLGELHLEEFTDYIYYTWIDKSMILLHGNCHMSVIQAYMESSSRFLDEYAIYPNPPIYSNEEKAIASVVLKYCDIWIHEDIRTDNAFSFFLSDEYIRQQWAINNVSDKDRVEIIVPHLFGLGRAFFPQTALGKNERNDKINNAQDVNGMFPHADLVIDKCVEKGMEEEDIIKYCMSDSVFNEEEVTKNFEMYMEKIKERESAWDIKIYNYLLENYRNEKMFYDAGHPTNVIMKKISEEILNRLGIDEDGIHTDLTMDGCENPIYPSVKRWLKLQWDESEIRKSHSARKCCDKMDFEEYVKEYLWWTHGYRCKGKGYI